MNMSTDMYVSEIDKNRHLLSWVSLFKDNKKIGHIDIYTDGAVIDVAKSSGMSAHVSSGPSIKNLESRIRELKLQMELDLEASLRYTLSRINTEDTDPYSILIEDYPKHLAAYMNTKNNLGILEATAMKAAWKEYAEEDVIEGEMFYSLVVVHAYKDKEKNRQLANDKILALLAFRNNKFTLDNLFAGCKAWLHRVIN